MKHFWAVLLGATLLVTACAPQKPERGNDVAVKNQSKIYKIRAQDRNDVLLRMVDAINVLRKTKSAPPLVLDAKLTSAAATHARDMSVQNRPWHFGSDGSSPLLRVQRTEYEGLLLGEAISESYDTELITLASWMKERAIRDIIMNPSARDLGFAWQQERSGKIWWVLLTGGKDIPGRRAPRLSEPPPVLFTEE